MHTERIRIVGAREHNLTGIDVDIPKRRLTAVTGVSGSGKSSLVFDTLAAEAQRQLNETYTSFVRNRLPRYGAPDVDAMHRLGATIVVDQRRLGGNARSTVGTVTEAASLLRLLYSRAARPGIGDSSAFSFNEPAGWCPECTGLGTVRSVDIGALLDTGRSLDDGAIRFPTFQAGGWMWRSLAESGHFDTGKPLRDYTEAEWQLLLRGDTGTAGRPHGRYEGLLTRFERIWLGKDVASLTGGTRAAFERVVTQRRCPACDGARLSAAARGARLNGHTLPECTAMEIAELVPVVTAVTDPTVAPVVAALRAQLDRLVSIGLGYLTLDRPTGTLSGGESQRVKMVKHLGSSLTDLTYVFDEPSAGLHPRDLHQVIDLLTSLRDKGNTVIVVEHDPALVAAADHVLELGPGAGAAGGRLTHAGPLAGLDTDTGRRLRRPPVVRTCPRPATGAISIRGAHQHNLRDVDVAVPTGVLTAVTGVAGSGKSSLVCTGLVAACPAAVLVDQAAVHVSRRSCPATYLGLLDPIRALFAAANGVSPALFSPNAEGGCRHCGGLGLIYTDLAFLDPMVTVCEHCGGERFGPEALRYRLAGHTIGALLRMSAVQAVEVFGQPRIRPVLERLVEVGLGYLPLGQPSTTLSGGERQRLKLAAELRHPGRVYLFDEPTTGLHPADTDGLLAIFDRLVARGHTVVVVEHDLDVVAHADHVIDLGPGAGRQGGRVVFTGPPADLAAADTATGRALAAALRAGSPR
ncbi:ATP-binding cassette domain-containing protein [Actinocatenispora thailandica]|nr:excinuclease ABC subunit UvrA [Actinocatenispora thailandica]